MEEIVTFKNPVEVPWVTIDLLYFLCQEESSYPSKQHNSSGMFGWGNESCNIL